MGNLAPVLLAFVLNLSGVSVFRETKNPGTEPLISSLIFLTSLFILLSDLRLYPGSLRRLWRCGTNFLDFTFASFLMEAIMNDFWWPLEASVIAFLPKVADFEKQILRQSGLSVGGVLQSLRTDSAAVASSYALSLFFMFSALHSTRIIDIRLLRCGPGIFLRDMQLKLHKIKKRVLRSFGFGRKRVNFKCCPTRENFDNEFFTNRKLPGRRRYDYLQ